MSPRASQEDGKQVDRANPIVFMVTQPMRRACELVSPSDLDMPVGHREQSLVLASYVAGRLLGCQRTKRVSLTPQPKKDEQG